MPIAWQRLDMAEMGEKENYLCVKEIIASEFAVSYLCGDKVFEKILENMVADTRIYVSFREISSIAPAFLHGLFAQIFDKFNKEELTRIMFVCIPDDVDLLRSAIELSRIYCENPKKFDLIFDKDEEL